MPRYPGSRPRRLVRFLAAVTLLQFGKGPSQIGNQVVLQDVILGEIDQRLIGGAGLEPGPLWTIERGGGGSRIG